MLLRNLWICFQKCFSLNDRRSAPRSFQDFYRFITIEMLCTNNMKFWLACQGDFNMRCINTKLYEVLYNDFLRHDAPYKVSVRISTIERIRCLLQKSAKLIPHSVLNVEELFKVAQQEIALQPLGLNSQNLDLYCMLDQSSKATKHQMFSNDLYCISRLTIVSREAKRKQAIRATNK